MPNCCRKANLGPGYTETVYHERKSADITMRKTGIPRISAPGTLWNLLNQETVGSEETPEMPQD